MHSTVKYVQGHSLLQTLVTQLSISGQALAACVALGVTLGREVGGPLGDWGGVSDRGTGLGGVSDWGRGSGAVVGRWGTPTNVSATVSNKGRLHHRGRLQHTGILHLLIKWWVGAAQAKCWGCGRVV